MISIAILAVVLLAFIVFAWYSLLTEIGSGVDLQSTRKRWSMAWMIAKIGKLKPVIVVWQISAEVRNV